MIPYINSWLETRRKRLTYTRMLTLDDRLLADIGMNRYDVQLLSRSGGKRA